MKELRFSTSIQSDKETVWATLWDDKTFRQWASIIDPGTYMVGELKKGNEVQFISSENGYGVTSLVEACIVYEFVLLRHSADTQDTGSEKREKQWTGGKEWYTLKESDGATELSVGFEVPDELREYFEEHYPVALARVKALAEAMPLEK